MDSAPFHYLKELLSLLNTSSASLFPAAVHSIFFWFLSQLIFKSYLLFEPISLWLLSHWNPNSHYMIYFSSRSFQFQISFALFHLFPCLSLSDPLTFFLAVIIQAVFFPPLPQIAEFCLNCFPIWTLAGYCQKRVFNVSWCFTWQAVDRGTTQPTVSMSLGKHWVMVH